MAAGTLLTLLDDIATLLDDVSVMTKVAAKKTAGVLGDDLALNAQQVAGVKADRELPVVWAVAKGSLRNKLILVPSALLISAVAPWAITPLLMLGGAFLCFEGFEKIAHRWLHPQDEAQNEHNEHLRALADPQIDLVAYERDKIRGAVRTDFILSAEIVVITLGTVADAAFGSRVAVLSGVAVIMTIGVYGLVAGIVKLDDAGLYLSQRAGQLTQRIGRALLGLAPRLMQALSVAGTAAMFLVGGGILAHGVPLLHHAVEALTHSLHGIPTVGGMLAAVAPTLLNALLGVAAGALVTLLVLGGERLRAARRTSASADT
ncbi:DUF808 domain-containing protein [Sinimarinibacterium sp. CAU 1509]|uniref:DUF808 domain-containing protein n=1 Tax=Sinimarinibacterium sp. CAU 1509 TaxID=2562283 RepID=UPI0010AD676C|nr:DUF808 domain-containing protein [Sinimarinibacterium sp. CAU 1509]TJY62261.1 DUF808 domain-containing protein [Sinimarinibacterium sp. CAU 1509]